MSNIPPRNREVSASDFRAVPEISIHSSTFGEPKGRLRSHQDAASIWNAWHIPLLPFELSDIFATCVSAGFGIDVVEKSYGALDINLRNSSGSYNEKGYDNALNRFFGGEVVMREEGSGTGRVSEMAFIELDAAFGVQEVGFHAQLAAGGYAWARMGYHLDKTDSIRKMEAEKLSQILLCKLQALQPYMPGLVYNFTKTFASLCNPDDIHKLACQSHDMSGRIDDFNWEGIHRDLQIGLGRIFIHGEAGDIAREAVLKMKAAARFSQIHEKPLTPGRLLLSGESWVARADYSNDAQMKTIEEYGGGFRTCAIMPKAETIASGDSVSHYTKG